MARAFLLTICACIFACGKPGARQILPEDVRDFQTLFAANCSGCHGPEGQHGAAPSLNYPLYLKLVPREELQRTIENGRPGTSMTAFARARGGPLYPAQVTAIVDGIEQNWATPVDLGGAMLPPYSAPLGDPAHGQQVFQKTCAVCHGEKGRVGPLVNASFLLLASNQGLRTAMIVGRPALGMPDWRHQDVPGGLSDQDISGLVAYLASNRPQLQPPHPAGENNTTPEKHQ